MKVRDVNELFSALSRSSFRSRFRLNARDAAYLGSRGLDVVIEHAKTFIADRLAPAHPTNDGKQTPMRGHPVFVAQHATATCCRNCLATWHGIASGRKLNNEEQSHIVDVISRWLKANAPSTSAVAEIKRDGPYLFPPT